jgi:hypothetical protein
MSREACTAQCQRVRRLLLAFVFNAPPSFSGNFSGGVRVVHCIIHRPPGPGYGTGQYQYGDTVLVLWAVSTGRQAATWQPLISSESFPSFPEVNGQGFRKEPKYLAG